MRKILFILVLAAIDPLGCAAALPIGMPVVVVGDVAECNGLPAGDAAAAKTAALASRLLGKGGNVIVLGDVTYPVGAATEYSACWKPTWGTIPARFIPAPGNHDYGTGKASAYFDYFGAAAGPEQRGYYSLDLGAWHVVSLNSMLTGSEGSAQLNWLRDDLASARGKQPCLLAFWHHPVFSSGLHGSDIRMLAAADILQKAHADIILSGHDHHYERFGHLAADGRVEAQAPRYFVVGSGGASLYPIKARVLGSEAAAAQHHGVLMLNLRDKAYHWAFHAVDAAVPLDSGEDACLAKH